tara:strand:+ start:954 stop:3638 length:2685 start_codon:yes stop_codon:yes gene_type:complete
MKNLLVLFVLVFALTNVNATHNRAGQISYKHISNLTYEITVTTFTDPDATGADRCTLDVHFGDGSMETVNRSNGVLNNRCTANVNTGDGELIYQNTIRKNRYITTHTYAGPGSYIITMSDPNRVDNIQNIPNSVSVPFFLRSTLVISSTVGPNTSPDLFYYPVDNGCMQKPYFHNPGAVDPDGDSLHFSFSVCYGDDGKPIPGYVLPNEINPNGMNNLEIDEQSGTLSWITPQAFGDFNVCILIQEFRRDTVSGQVIKVGDVLRDMQMTIGACDNDPPTYDPLPDECVLANDTVKRAIRFNDVGDLLTLTGSGLPLNLNISPAKFNQPVIELDSVESVFYWETLCDHIRTRSYQMVFRAADNRQLSELVNFSTLNVLIVGPPSNFIDAEPKGNSVQLSWSVNPCDNAVGYKIYRKIDSLGYVPDKCVVGVPAFTGYKLIAKVSSYNLVNYTDDNDGEGLVHGHKYCYMITGVYPDGVESLPTFEACTQLKKDVPVITRVSIRNTSESFGRDTVMWASPTELDDTVQFLGPYQYRIYRKINDFPFEQIGLTNIVNNIEDGDTMFVDENLNTKDDFLSYKIELTSGVDVVGETQKAQSLYLQAKGLDRSMLLTWDVQVPWTNYFYEVHRFNELLQLYELLDTAYGTQFIDSGLINETSYCYLVKSIGKYSTSGFIDPLINWSQISCAAPTDTIPPCNPLNIVVEGDCDLDRTYLFWENPKIECGDDIWKYRIYYAPKLGDEYEFIYETVDADETEYEKISPYSIAGCYEITALDSSGNESIAEDRFCIDNCPNYRLPNVFTPGGDGANDFFVPLPYKHVESINMKIYDRWGSLVFKATNPAIGWDGRHFLTNRILPSGVYFYVCTVNEIRLTGIEPMELKGTVTIFNQKDRNPTSN